jgi:hypothetical protein
MDIVLNSGNYGNLDNRLLQAIYNCKIKSAKETLSLLFENLSMNEGLNYIGELNKNDIML